MKVYQGKTWNVELLPRLGSFWVGIHYSKTYQSFCIAIIPCLVIRLGKTSYIKDPDVWERREDNGVEWSSQYQDDSTEGVIRKHRVSHYH